MNGQFVFYKHSTSLRSEFIRWIYFL